MRIFRSLTSLPKLYWHFFGSLLLILLAGWIAWPNVFTLNLSGLQSWLPQVPQYLTVQKSQINLTPIGIPFRTDVPLQYGLDIQGGTQVTLEVDMSSIPEADRETALTSAVEVIRRRVDLYGVAETNIRTAVFQDQYRIVVELPGIDQPETALQLIGQTAQLQFQEFQYEESTSSADLESEEATPSVTGQFVATGLGGDQLSRATVQFSPQTGEPVVNLEFSAEGADLFAEITERNLNQPLAIALDDQIITAPIVNQAIYGGQAQISGQFSVEEAETLATQLNAGALPVPIEIVEQTTIGPTLGQTSLEKSVFAGMVGLVLVAFFMIFLYGWSGFLAVIGLLAYGIITLALYKLIPVTLTLPGVAGLMLSIGMAVDANILTFERMKEELRANKPWNRVIKDGFGRSWDSIKDANLATLSICFILFNPFEWGFLHTSGPVRGFALTLALGIGVGLFTGVFFSRILLQLFLAPPKQTERNA
ncbi:protein translocase subunit SecD [Candidatus Woesebacteria bacterium]|nr:protein translocase subunit SecD [Candidatus Woesebacteria bacterium]MCD8507327.1 protein translocase subunit SecD [Candidatus Woesebacteria bacterium]MCD8527717.1 protein translocase subunit SecD [Candidatus Woesebacteria bacterium]MCD8546452.1 protein translocase subunit SecD [Candidatus Woesebacteria bacterium]